MAVTLMLGAVITPETFVSFYKTTWRSIPQYSPIRARSPKNLKPYINIHRLICEYVQIFLPFSDPRSGGRVGNLPEFPSLLPLSVRILASLVCTLYL
jgi:hypothetical protein